MSSSGESPLYHSAGTLQLRNPGRTDSTAYCQQKPLPFTFCPAATGGKGRTWLKETVPSISVFCLCASVFKFQNKELKKKLQNLIIIFYNNHVIY